MTHDQDLARRLGETLHRRADALHDTPLDLTDVRGRATSIRRRRHTVVGLAAAAAVAAVVLPLSLLPTGVDDPVVPAAGQQGQRQHDRGDRQSHGGVAAATDRRGATADVPEVERGVVERVGAPVHGLAQPGGQVLVVAHRSSSRRSVWRGSRLRGARSRRPASARLAWDFTVPVEIPMTSAISASERSS